MISSDKVSQIAMKFGADACGVASIERFSNAPTGFNPKDVYSKCNSAIVFLKTMPSEVILAENPVPYTHIAYQLYSELDRIGLAVCRELEQRGTTSVPIPSDTPYLCWDTKRTHGMGVISLRHAGWLAGLGILGRNTLLINKEFGNMVYIGAILTNAELEPSPMVEGFDCPPNCKICLEVCPAKALDGITVNQERCRKTSFFKTERGFDIYACSKCRQKCPLRLGKK
ncbi:MAG: epoxyqueuosine reductase [Bacteroidales bacterium]|nr:epoxyqueuosine reductase [Bacteroidales bacterium]